MLPRRLVALAACRRKTPSLPRASPIATNISSSCVLRHADVGSSSATQTLWRSCAGLTSLTGARHVGQVNCSAFPACLNSQSSMQVRQNAWPQSRDTGQQNGNRHTPHSMCSLTVRTNCPCSSPRIWAFCSSTSMRSRRPSNSAIRSRSWARSSIRALWSCACCRVGLRLALSP